MPQPAGGVAQHFPPIPDETVQEGGRWRHHRPTSEQVAAWFATQPLDEGMEHARFVGGVVIIPQSEKVKYTRRDSGGTIERYEMTFTPYMGIGTRVAYARMLAEYRGLVYHPAPAKVPRSQHPESPYFNGNMPDGLWWHVVRGDNGYTRYLCATYEVAIYEPQTYMAKLRGQDPLPLLYGQGTKQVTGGDNALMRAQTGAIGRALGVAGILVVGTGIATSEDMQEYVGSLPADQQGATPQLPLVPSEIAQGEPPPEVETLDGLRSRALALQTQMQEDAPQKWAEFVHWWNERKQAEGWGVLADVPLEGLKAIIAKMEALHQGPAR